MIKKLEEYFKQHENYSNNSDEDDDFYDLYDKHIEGKKIEEYTEYREFYDGKYQGRGNMMPQFIFEGGWSIVVGYSFDPQKVFIVNPDNEVESSDDFWNK